MNTNETQLRICNLALTKLRITQRLAAVPGTTVEGGVFDAVWEQVLNEVLELGEWRCARKRIVLSEGVSFLENGDCEEITQPYVKGDEGSLIDATFVQNSSRFYEGSYSFKLTKTIAPGDPGTARFTTYLNDATDLTALHGLAPGRTYKLSGRCFVPEVNTGPSDVNESLLGIAYYDGGAWTHVQTQSTLRSQWEYVTTGKVIIPATATGIYLYVQIASTAENLECVCWDDLRFHESTNEDEALGYRYQFALPEDCIKILETAVDRLGWVEENNFILTNAEDDELSILYAYYLSDPTYFSPLLADTVATRLAVVAGPSIKADKQRIAELDKEFAALLSLSKEQDIRYRQSPDKHSALITDV